jgi:queuosine precursor transporter
VSRLLSPLILLSAPAAAALAFVLAGFGATPPEQLPLAAIVWLGLLLGAAVHVASRVSPAAGSSTGLGLLGAAAGVAVALATPLPDAYAWASATAAATAGILRLRGALGERDATVLTYVACIVLANFTLDSFIPLGDFFLVNVGTFFFGVTLTQRDRLHRFGRPFVYRVIVLAGVANVIAAWSLGTPLRYVAVSFLAILLSESVDTEVYQRLLHRRWFARVAGSNAVSAPLDTIVFTTLAFAGEAFATTSWMLQVIVTDVLVKYGAGLLAAVTLLRFPAWRGERA